jgi:hypothetical protein
MFGRSKPATITCASRRPRNWAMSARTCGVAVAVNAERLARSGRHHREHVAALDDGTHHGLWPGRNDRRQVVATAPFDLAEEAL